MMQYFQIVEEDVRRDIVLERAVGQGEADLVGEPGGWFVGLDDGVRWETVSEFADNVERARCVFDAETRFRFSA